jgi:hypothetical protein
MSLYAADLINCLPNIENLSYLELGVWYGNTFNKINCKDKVGVDLRFPATYSGITTDEFFSINFRQFDIIFIDADHSCLSVARDFNNSIKRAKKFILMHDLVPPDRNHAKSTACGDAYKILNYFIDNHINYLTLRNPEDCGLTVVIPPFKEIEVDKIENIDYDVFVDRTKPKVKFREFNNIIESIKS